MTKLRLIVIPMVIAFVLAACSPNVEPSAADEEVILSTLGKVQDFPTTTNEPAASATETVALVPTETIVPTETATVAPSPSPVSTATPEEITGVSDTCLGCHMDKERVIETAAPEEKTPSESSGVG